MDREQAAIEVKSRYAEYLKPARRRVQGKTTYVCPLCGNGTGSTGDGMEINPKAKSPYVLKCHKCGFNGNIVDIYIQEHGCDAGTAFRALYDYFGIIIDEKSEPRERKEVKKVPEEKVEEPQADIMDFLKKCKEAFKGSPAEKYINGRGISSEVASKYWLGYVENFKGIKKGLVIPTGKGSCTVRNTEEGDRFRKEGSSLIFNKKILSQEDKTPIYVCEAEIDALSVIEVGGRAVGLGSTSNKDNFIKLIEDKAPAAPLILSLDEDEAGRACAEYLEEELRARGVLVYKHNPCGDKKDANEALVEDRAAFTEKVREGERIALADLEEKKEERLEKYREFSALSYIDQFKDGIKERAKTPPIKTGFDNLDELLDGGVFEGLYFLGANSSLGKTTFGLQLADNVARSGQDVFIFSLEMARTELMAKSISRISFLQAKDKTKAKTTRAILTGRYMNSDQVFVDSAVEEYKQYAGSVMIYEGTGDIGTEKIGEEVRQYIEDTGKRPLVLIDYLQILAPFDVRASDKQAVDKNVLELKRISRAYKIPIIGISSFNRDSYTEPVSMSSFKESGSIEYSSDVLIGLQLKGMDYIEGETEKARLKRIRDLIREAEYKGAQGEAQEIQLKILKNRNGRKGQAFFNFYPMFNTFEDSKGFAPVPEEVDKELSELFTDIKKGK